MRRSVGAAVALFALASAAPAQPPAPAARGEVLRLVDLTDEFAAFAASTAGLPDAQRVALFRARFEALLPGFYSRRFDERGQERIAAGLAGWANDRAGIEEVSRRFADLFRPALASFEAEFGPFASPQPIYLLHSFGEMDGGTRTLPEGQRLVFGADVIARLHLGHDITPFFHHELFHVYHAERFAECEPLWCGLWSEGLATYAAARLNPGASDAELLLTVPEPIRPAVDAHLEEAVCETAARLDSTDPADGRALFSFDRLNERLPPRFGYYVGYLAAAELGREHSLQALAALDPAAARRALDGALAALANCAAR